MSELKSVSDLAVSGVQQLVPYTPGKPIEELERELGLTEIVKLASNENPLGTNPQVIDAIQTVLPELTRYPDGNGFRLKAALAEKHAVSPEQITLGNGSNDVLEILARTFLSSEKEAVFSQHAFAVYPIVTQAVGAKAVIIPALDYGHDLAAMSTGISPRTGMVFIANPNNPTGTLLSAEAVENFIKQLPATVICVLDEAYYEYIDPQLSGNSVDWLAKYPNLVITRTFSKAYGLAGLRVGYSLSSPEIADLLNRVRQPFNNNMVALAAAEAALADEQYLSKTVAANRSGMRQLTDGFQRLGLQWIPSAGNFVSVHLAQPAMPVYDALLRKGVIVRPIANYEMPEHLRISIGLEQENDKLLQALAEIL